MDFHSRIPARDRLSVQVAVSPGATAARLSTLNGSGMAQYEIVLDAEQLLQLLGAVVGARFAVTMNEA